MSGLASCLTTHGYVDTRIQENSFLTNVSEFKRYVTPLPKDFDIKPVLTKIENP